MTTCSTTNKEAFRTTDEDTCNEQELAAQAKALAHPARVRIMRVLLALHNSGGCLNSSLVSELGLAQSTVSEHLRILKEAGFITAEPDPPRVCYRINLEKVQAFSEMFAAIFS
ncbi:ArsR/SmtB family transcription factor [Halodesulfovibrio spirochaetisodalis]|uniref:Transcriptional regulator n=1 Tax=Halodesulfovibrio spirochaetisodalis TaxID=1560234 RepID=A0A1B7XMX9_9BACT|nr:winged helix-turn-helix domain-containing protein [Halodesulfovibrio spirochaetisodalis]OBQ56872.1 transcriptional regulator [Halodesulfovibrio spirochaetisodalis]